MTAIRLLASLCSTLLVFGCSDTENGKTGDQPSNPKLDIEVIDETSFHFSMETRSGVMHILWGDEGYEGRANLDSLTGSQGYRIPPTVIWTNEKYACLMTNHTASFSQHIFLPLDSGLSLLFVPEDIEFTDPGTDVYCCIDSSNMNIAYWSVRSLTSESRELFTIENCLTSSGYPWAVCQRVRDSLSIIPQCDTVEIRRISLFSTEPDTP